MKDKFMIIINILFYIFAYIIVIFTHLMTEPIAQDNILWIFDLYAKFHLEWYILTLLSITILIVYNIKILYFSKKNYGYKSGFKFIWILFLILFIGFLLM